MAQRMSFITPVESPEYKSRKLKAMVQRVAKVNTLPLIKEKVSLILNMENSSLRDLEAVIRRDPSLAEGIVSLSNSSRYGQSNKRTDISQALMVMGFNVVRDFVRGVPAFDMDKVAPEVKSLWNHSSEVAETARDIASRADDVSIEDAFLAGLLHDVGRIILFQLFKGEYLESTLHLKKPTELIEKEEEIFGDSHQKVGGWFLQGALLPEKIMFAVENHHTPMKAARYRELAATLYFAEYLVAKDSDPYSGIEDGSDTDLKWVLDLLKLKETDMVDFMVGVVTRREKIAVFYT